VKHNLRATHFQIGSEPNTSRPTETQEKFSPERFNQSATKFGLPQERLEFFK
jgi:hypothetical protein